MRVARLLFAVLFAGCTCGGEVHGHDAGRPAPSPPVALDAQQAMVRDWLRAQAVSETHFGAPVLYSWLDDAALEALRGGGSVATTSSSETDPFDAAIAQDESAVAAQLRSPERGGRRRAWPSAWPIRRRLAPDAPAHLARIELRPESVLLLYDARTTPPTIHFSTERGVAAPFEEASRVPDLWAAVLFVHTCEGAPCREYVLVSPSMIGRVSLGSTEIGGELRTDRERLLRLAHDAAETAEPPTSRALDAAWAALPAADAPTTVAYAAALATGEGHALARTPLVELAGMLVDRTEPFEWRTALPSEPRPHFFE